MDPTAPDLQKESCRLCIADLFNGKLDRVHVKLRLHSKMGVQNKLQVLVNYDELVQMLQEGFLQFMNATSTQETDIATVYAEQNTACILECPVSQQLLQQIDATKGVTIVVSREIQYLLQRDQLGLNSNVKPLGGHYVELKNSSNDQLVRDIAKILANPMYTVPQQRKLFTGFPRPPRPLSPHYKNEVQQQQEQRYAPLYHTSHTLTLNKLEVTFLIGHQGSRIEFIREQSGACVKILPIPERLKTIQLASPYLILQAIVVSGTLSTVTVAMALIESQLQCYRPKGHSRRKARACIDSYTGPCTPMDSANLSPGQRNQ
ncbi:LAMI_0F14290g1_1 [Lachancea mirantina]|uniref:LAMI_0F14290g1_1 n=1 Tax=Lachancea mirantina TaxID=1230905 RepID=A0A1G4K3W0_9SACH|nr:LAMI_0F14290g1_1 [Lachancea mirantina]